MRLTAIVRDSAGNAASQDVVISTALATTFAVVAGDGVTVTPGSRLQVVVETRDSAGQPVSGMQVWFRAITGGGRFCCAVGDPIGAVGDERMATTNALGRAEAEWVTGTASGEQTAEIEVVGIGTQVIRINSGSAPPPPPPPPSGSQVIATLDLDNMSLGDFHTAATSATEADGPNGEIVNPDGSYNIAFRVINDPTGGVGRVLEARYVRSNINSSKDVNRAVQYETNEAGVPGLSWGESLHFEGEVYIPYPATNERGFRKLLYFQTNNNAGKIVISHYVDNRFALDGTRRPDGRARVHRLGVNSFPYDQWHRIEMDAVMNSAVGVEDGSIIVRLNGVEIWNFNDFYVLNEGRPLVMYKVGQQEQGYPDGDTMLFDNLRYWRNVQLVLR